MSAISPDELERLRAIEERHRLLFMNMGAGFVLYELLRDESGAAVDAVMLEVNPSFERMIGVTPGSLDGRRVREALPYFNPAWLPFLATVVDTGQPATRIDHLAPRDLYFEVWAYRPKPACHPSACRRSDAGCDAARPRLCAPGSAPLRT